MSSLISLTSFGFASKGFTSTHHSFLHETAQPSQACHDKIRLPGGLVVCLASDGRAHQVVVHIDFFDKTANMVTPAKWYETWSACIEEKKSKGTLSYLGLPIEPEHIGLKVRAIIVGRRASLDWSLVEEDDAPFDCRHGCKTYKISGDNGRPKLVESSSTAATRVGQRTVHTPYGAVRYDPKVVPRGHVVGTRVTSSSLDYLDY